MKVFRFYAPGDVRIEDDYPEPVAGPGEVKIRVRACSMCGTDVKIATSGHQRMRPPRVMGHEIAGEVVEVGDGVTGWQTGDRVQVIAAIPCGHCDFCRAGLQTICPNQLSMGYDFDGATFSHVGDRVTFEVVARSFGLDGDVALAHIGRVVHAVDVGGLPVDEAPGLEMVVRGLQARHAQDDALLDAATELFDTLYLAAQKAPE